MNRYLLMFSMFFVSACGEGSGRETDVGLDTRDTSMADSGDVDDLASTDTMTDLADSQAPGEETLGDVSTDAIPDVADSHDAGSETSGPTTIVAIPGERCAIEEVIGTVEIERQGAMVYLTAHVDDRPDPWIAAAEFSTDSCAFHRFTPRSCESCADDERCGADGTCVDAPVRLVPEIALTSGTETQSFSAEPTTGQVWGQVTLADGPFGVLVTLGDWAVTLAPTAIPEPLEKTRGVLEGSYDAPTKVTLTWEPGPTDSVVHTRVPINHHAGVPTFTDCGVPASSGKMEISEDMLMPLAIVTGLEFQGLSHIRFAAAETDAGCIEFRHLVRDYTFLETR
jgi:hypothetical protein